jgi:micrococcal nuclease
MRIRVLALLLVVMLMACRSGSVVSDRVSVKVERAVSGNTVEVAGDRIRLVGVDAPRLGNKPWGPAARDRLNEIIKEAGSDFMLELDEKSVAAPKDQPAADGDAEPAVEQRRSTPDNYKYGYLWRGDTLVNAQLIREGQGVAVTKYAKYEQQLVRSQYYARMMAVGIWSHVSPMRDNSRTKSD